MVKVLAIEGACIDTVDMKEFSLDEILTPDDVQEIKEARADGHMESAADVTVKDANGQTVVTCFDYDGAPLFYIGVGFVGPRDIQ